MARTSLTFLAILAILAVLAVACAPQRPDPRLTAMEAFRDAALEMTERDDARQARLAGLHVGMTPEQVLDGAGPPTSRQTHRVGGTSREVWTYRGDLKVLGTLEFEEGRLVAVTVH